MKPFISVGAFLVLITPTMVIAQTPAVPGPDQNNALLKTYCVTCHNSRLKTGGLALDALNLQSAPDDAQIWRKPCASCAGT